MNIEVINFHDITGATHKELGAQEAISDAIDRGLDAICVISSGNYIEALREASGERVEVFNLVNREAVDDFEIEIPKEVILKTPSKRVDLVRSKGYVGNIDDYTDFIPEAYSNHALKILESSPDYILCPAGSGKLWVSIVKEVEAQGLGTRVIGVTPKDKNGFYESVEDCFQKSVADKLTAPFTSLREDALAMAPKHIIAEVSERELKSAYAKAKREGIICEASGAAGFVIYDRKFRREYDVDDDDSIMVVSTGLGVEAALESIKKPRDRRNLKGVVSIIAAIGLGVSFIHNVVPDQSVQSQPYELTIVDRINFKNNCIDDLRQDEHGQIVLHNFMKKGGHDSPYDLSLEKLSDAIIVDEMGRTGQSYVIRSQDSRLLKLYEEFGV